MQNWKEKTNMIGGIMRGRGKDVSMTKEEYGIWEEALLLPLASSSSASNIAQIFFAAPIFLFLFSFQISPQISILKSGFVYVGGSIPILVKWKDLSFFF